MDESILSERLAEIVRLEEDIDRCLPDRRKARVYFEWREAARSWAAAIWDLARTLGPTRLDQGALARGLASAARPVFICGAHRSGTTLLRDLLDGHPAFCALPSEATFFSSLERKFAGRPPDAFAAACGQEWLCRIANPNNQPPYWLLGRSDAAGSPYLDFARDFLAWLEAATAPGGDASPSAPLVAFALAYARCPSENSRRWVDKTPGNERFLARIWREFDAAQVVHMIRDPVEVAASQAALMRQANSRARGLTAALRELIRSYRLAHRRLRQESPGRYRVVRYEELVAEPCQVMEDLAAFLEIEPAPILFDPTVGGRPTTSNTSFPDGKREDFRPEGAAEWLHLAVAKWYHRQVLRHLG